MYEMIKDALLMAVLFPVTLAGVKIGNVLNTATALTKVMWGTIFGCCLSDTFQSCELIVTRESRRKAGTGVYPSAVGPAL